MCQAEKPHKAGEDTLKIRLCLSEKRPTLYSRALEIFTQSQQLPAQQ